MTSSTISSKVQSVISRIQKATDHKPLLKLYDNAVKYPSITEFERELIVEEIELKLREISPSKASKIFGPKDAAARDFLESVYSSISEEFDLQKNEVRNGIKVGGDMIAGRKHIDLYISYKNAEKWNVGLAWMQDSVDGEPYLRIRKYRMGISNLESLSDNLYSMAEASAAIENYRIALLEAIR